MSIESHTHTKQDCLALLLALVPDLTEVMEAVAPMGWAKSTLYQVAHPTPEQRLEVAQRAYKAVQRFKTEKSADQKTPTLADFQDVETAPAYPLNELRSILGDCLWDIFSDNNEVVDAQGVVYDLGSFRGSGRFIADFLNQHPAIPEGTTFDYIDFYMGSYGRPEPDILTPVYIYLFTGLKVNGCDWICDRQSRIAPDEQYLTIDAAYADVYGHPLGKKA